MKLLLEGHFRSTGFPSALGAEQAVSNSDLFSRDCVGDGPQGLIQPLLIHVRHRYMVLSAAFGLRDKVRGF